MAEVEEDLKAPEYHKPLEYYGKCTNFFVRRARFKFDRNGVVVRSPFRAKHHVVMQYMAAGLKYPLPPSLLPDPPPPTRPPPPPEADLWMAENYGDLNSRSNCISLSGHALMFAQFSLSG